MANEGGRWAPLKHRATEGIKKGADKLKTRASEARVSIRDNFRNPLVVEGEKVKQHAIEVRDNAFNDPSYPLLEANMYFQEWKDGNEIPHLTDSEYTSKVFGAIARHEPGVTNPYDEYEKWYNERIDPDLKPERLKDLCRSYCHTAGTAFINNAKEVAQTLSVAPTDDTRARLLAIQRLMGKDYSTDHSVKNYYNDESIFPTQNFLFDYRTIFERLGVSYEDAQMDKEKVMAAVDVCVALWVQLGDLGAIRPTTSHPFGPAIERGSFVTLLTDSGWAEANGVDPKDIGFMSLVESSTKEREEFLRPFRDPKYFATAAQKLEAT